MFFPGGNLGISTPKLQGVLFNMFDMLDLILSPPKEEWKERSERCMGSKRRWRWSK